MDHILTRQSRCRFGIARADVTPPVGIYHRMWGAATHDRSEGVHRPLTATAMYFGSHEPLGTSLGQQVLIAIDHCLLGVQEVAMILDRVSEQTDVARESIVLTFSHTHAAGLLNLDRKDLPGGDLIPAYLDQLADHVARIVASASDSASEVEIVYGTGRCNLAAHRDYYDADASEYVCGYDPDGRADDTVMVARITASDGTLLASLVNYACHPTTLAWDNRLISPDFPGAMRETIEQATGATCVFLQGASGELGPVEGFVGDTDIADRNGRQLAYAALSVIESLPPPGTSFQYAGKVVSGASIGTWRHVEVDEERAAELGRWNCERKNVPLAYRHDLPTRTDVAARHASLVAQEQAARQDGDTVGADELRALVERQTRMLGRLQGMPDGEFYPYEVAVWRMGDAVWVATQGEPYSRLQQQLRASFPGTPIVVATIANGWGPSYLPPEDLYGKGIYQETIAALSPGSLESLIETLRGRIATLLA